MERWPEGIWDYITDHTRMRDPLLDEMERRAADDDFPIIGPAVGSWLYFFARLISATRIFELGSGFGYSTWYLAKAIKANGGGIVVHTVWDDELSQEARVWMDRAGLLSCCDFQVCEATLALQASESIQDIIFMDINKDGYIGALPIIEEKLRAGGLLLVDNMLWNGRVIDPADTSVETKAVRQLNDALTESRGWEYIINPLRDGLGIARRL